jgi:hypothetical protein
MPPLPPVTTATLPLKSNWLMPHFSLVYLLGVVVQKYLTEQTQGVNRPASILTPILTHKASASDIPDGTLFTHMRQRGILVARWRHL